MSFAFPLNSSAAGSPCTARSGAHEVLDLSQAAPIASPAVPRPAPPQALQVRCLSFGYGEFALSPDRGTFVDAWNARLGATPHANFSMSLDYLAWQVRRGEPSRAFLLDDEGRHGAMVLRECGGEIVCGFPWRWQVVLESADPASPYGMTAGDAAWFFAQVRRFAKGRRLRFYAPHALGSGIEYRAARTILIDLRHASEEQLFADLSSSRRSRVRQSRRAGCSIVIDPSPEQRSTFGQVVRETHARRHHGVHDNPDPPEIEWAQPWHWLILGVRGGEVTSGLGLGRFVGGMVDARASGATADAMRSGAPSQVWWEAIRQARLAGHSWANLCGGTVFKQELGGEVVTVHCALGGSKRWLVPQVAEKLGAEVLALAVRTRQGARAMFGKIGRTVRSRGQERGRRFPLSGSSPPRIESSARRRR